METEAVNKPEENKKKEGIYLTIIILLLCACGVLGWMISSVNGELSVSQQNFANLMEERNTLNGILESAGISESLDPDNITSNLNTVLDELNERNTSLFEDNTSLKDSVDAKTSRINEIMEELEKEKKRNKWNYGKIYKLQKEAETLRTIMKGYIHTIDSLNTLNIELQNEIVVKDDKIKKVSAERDQLQDQYDASKETIALGKILQTSSPIGEGIRIRSSGKQTPTTRANRTDMVKCCLTILENKIAEPGNKTIYMSVISPEGKVLGGVAPVSFPLANGSNGTASVKRQVNYKNSNTDLCIYYDVEEELATGTYIIEVYADGHKIGKTSFALK